MLSTAASSASITTPSVPACRSRRDLPIPDFEKVAPLVVSQVESALHPEFAALLMRPPGEPKYRVLSSSGNAPPSIPADSKLIGMARLLGKPLEVSPSQSGWLRQLPQQEIRLLQQAHVEWLFPVSLIEGQTEALLVMGPKKSEEPYSWEDQELLQGIIGSLALLLEQTSSKGFEVCPECGTCYDTGSGKCRKEGADLTPLSSRGCWPIVIDSKNAWARAAWEWSMSHSTLSSDAMSPLNSSGPT